MYLFSLLNGVTRCQINTVIIISRKTYDFVKLQLCNVPQKFERSNVSNMS